MMTTIELRFYESAIQFFREHKNQKVDMEELKLLLTSAIILGGMCSNYAHPTPSTFRADDAVKLATALMTSIKKGQEEKECK